MSRGTRPCSRASEPRAVVSAQAAGLLSLLRPPAPEVGADRERAEAAAAVDQVPVDPLAEGDRAVAQVAEAAAGMAEGTVTGTVAEMAVETAGGTAVGTVAETAAETVAETVVEGVEAGICGGHDFAG